MFSNNNDPFEQPLTVAISETMNENDALAEAGVTTASPVEHLTCLQELHQRSRKQFKREEKIITKNSEMVSRQYYSLLMQIKDAEQALRRNDDESTPIKHTLETINTALNKNQSELNKLNAKANENNATLLVLKKNRRVLGKKRTDANRRSDHLLASQLDREIATLQGQILPLDVYSLAEKIDIRKIEKLIADLLKDAYRLQKDLQTLTTERQNLIEKLKHLNEMKAKVSADWEACRALKEKYKAFSAKLNEMTKKLYNETMVRSCYDSERLYKQPQQDISVNNNNHNASGIFGLFGENNPNNQQPNVDAVEQWLYQQNPL